MKVASPCFPAKRTAGVAIVLLILLSFVGVMPKAPAASAATTPAAGVAVPLYTYPTDSSWSSVIQAKQAYPNVPFIAVINPNSGPGASSDSNYVTGIKNLQAAGIEVLGYVYTSYSSRSTSSVEADVNTYNSWYHVNGIFFDEMSNVAGYETYYSTVSSYAQSLGMSATIGNAGTAVPTSYIGTVTTICIYEGNGLPSLSSISYPGYSPSNFYVIALGVSLSTSFLSQAAASASWFYLTDASGSNPYGVLPSYFISEVAALSTIDSTLTTTTTTPSGLAASISVNSADLSGNAFTGMWTTFSQNGAVLASGYTTDSFVGTTGNTYVVDVANYGSYVFCHWQDGSTNAAETVALSGNVALTAYYSTTGSCPPATTTTTTSTTSTTSAASTSSTTTSTSTASSTTSTVTSTSSTTTTSTSSTSSAAQKLSKVLVTVGSSTTAGVQFTGMWLTVKSNGRTIASGYTSLTFSAIVGVSYTVTVSNYGNYVFQYWNDGSTNAALTIKPTQPTMLIAYYSTG